MNWLSPLFGPDGWIGLLLEGTVVTVLLAVLTVPFGMSGGLAIAVLRSSPSTVVRRLCDAYTTFIRGIPDLLTLFIIYFGLQILIDKITRLTGLPHVEINAFAAAVIALSVVVSAYSSEVWVAALKSVDRGQIEAAQSLGLSRAITFRKVTLPQLMRVALLGLSNIWSVLVKDTSLVSTLAVMDLLRAASQASRATTRPILFFSAAAAIYLLISIISTIAQSHFENRLNRGRG